MLKVDDEIVKIGHFPDKTLLMKYCLHSYFPINIKWNYESDEEIFSLICLTKHLQKLNSNIDIHLHMPYIPHARMDRVKGNSDIFTLKYFSEIINSLNFSSVTVLDPHSSVSEALIDKLIIINPFVYINIAKNQVINAENEEPLMFYPDEGAAKRYANLINAPYSYGIKNRDWKSGNILSLDVVGDIKQNKPILIVDDICSKGGTFYHSAVKLKELGSGNIYLYITHCENSILDGDLINSGLIEKVFTTNSILNKSHVLIEMIEL